MLVTVEWKWISRITGKKRTTFKTLLLKYCFVLFKQDFKNLNYRVSTSEISLFFAQMRKVTLWFLKKCHHSLILCKLVQIAIVKLVLKRKKQLFCVVSRTFMLSLPQFCLIINLNFLNSPR